mmetsp:Transcript_31776/g.48646  ORF Transcript_31776/g.48646 Transcript_31776/m.48646 type:complete len:111 (-) Transcript_31776:1350-1682(-)
MTARLSEGVNKECRPGDQLPSASEISKRHSSIDRWVKQFHGFDEETGLMGIIDRKTGDETGGEDSLGGEREIERTVTEIKFLVRCCVVSIRAPPRRNSRKTSELPRATAT